MKNKAFFVNIKLFFNKNSFWLLLLLIFSIHLFLRFYGLEIRSVFGWDQVDNAWAAKNIIVDHKFPLVGMVAKLNSGFYIGPIYYYAIAFFYWLFNLDPIASGIFAGITSFFTFLILFLVTQKLFSRNIALISVFLYAVSFYTINFDRTQWPVDFIPFVSLIIFYSIFNIIIGNIKYLLVLGLALGFSFHTHFTSVFYLIIVILASPFFPRNKKALRYLVISIFLFLIFILPTFLSESLTKNSQSQSLLNYVQTYTHGFHLTRFLQLGKDAFIEFDSLLEQIPGFANIKFVKYLFLPLFCFSYFSSFKNKKSLIICYLFVLWFLVPWFVFSLYKGEISNYYFSITLPISIITLAYLIARLYETKYIFLKLVVLIFLIGYSCININLFLNSNYKNLEFYRKKVEKDIEKGIKIEFVQGAPESYIYYLHERSQKANE